MGFLSSLRKYYNMSDKPKVKKAKKTKKVEEKVEEKKDETPEEKKSVLEKLLGKKKED